MRTSTRLVALLAVAIGAVACGDDGAPSTTNASNTSVTTPIAPLTTMLLAVDDLGTGWELGPPLNEADFADVVRTQCPDTAVNPTILARVTGNAGIQFSPTDRSSRHLIETLVSGEPGQLERDIQALLDAMQPCPDPATVTYEALTLPALGDQGQAATYIGVVSADTAWHVRHAIVRVGAVALVLGLTEILPTPQSPPSITDEEFIGIVTAAVAKLSG